MKLRLVIAILASTLLSAASAESSIFYSIQQDLIQKSKNMEFSKNYNVTYGACNITFSKNYYLKLSTTFQLNGSVVALDYNRLGADLNGSASEHLLKFLDRIDSRDYLKLCEVNLPARCEMEKIYNGYSYETYLKIGDVVTDVQIVGGWYPPRAYQWHMFQGIKEREIMSLLQRRKICLDNNQPANEVFQPESDLSLINIGRDIVKEQNSSNLSIGDSDKVGVTIE